MRVALLACTLLLAPLALQDPEPSPGPAVGKPAPMFRLNDHQGRAVRVGGEAESWTVVAFFPKAATPG